MIFHNSISFLFFHVERRRQLVGSFSYYNVCIAETSNRMFAMEKIKATDSMK